MLRRDRSAGPQESLPERRLRKGHLSSAFHPSAAVLLWAQGKSPWTPLLEGSRLGSPPERCLQLPRAGAVSA